MEITSFEKVILNHRENRKYIHNNDHCRYIFSLKKSFIVASDYGFYLNAGQCVVVSPNVTEFTMENKERQLNVFYIVNVKGVENTLWPKPRVCELEKFKELTQRINAGLHRLFVAEEPSSMDAGLADLSRDMRALMDRLHEQGSSANAARKMDDRMIKVNRYLNKYVFKPITLEDLSAVINCNPVYLCNTYTKMFGISPMKQIQKFRMFKAAQLLNETELKVNDIAQSVGYISTSQFCRLFKRYYGITPTYYRKIKLETREV